MRTLTFAALLGSLTLSASPIEAQRLGGNGAQSTSVRSAPSIQSRGGSPPDGAGVACPAAKAGPARTPPSITAAPPRNWRRCDESVEFSIDVSP